MPAPLAFLWRKTDGKRPESLVLPDGVVGDAGGHGCGRYASECH